MKKVLIVHPDMEPEETFIEDGLSVLQKIVGGNIEIFRPTSHEDDAVIICNDEGKLNGCMPNRPLLDENMKCLDIVYGTFIVCSMEGDEMTSLTNEQVEKYSALYSLEEAEKHLIELLVMVSGGGDADEHSVC